jgi:hypothetical protein
MGHLLTNNAMSYLLIFCLHKLNWQYATIWHHSGKKNSFITLSNNLQFGIL